jgi:hypothetical protein
MGQKRGWRARKESSNERRDYGEGSERSGREGRGPHLPNAIQQVSLPLVPMRFPQLTFRLFSPIESDDARHDEVLASRIAALNMLDLSLDHLGLITQPDEVDEEIEDKHAIQNGLRDVVEQIGEGMSSG